MVTPLLRAESLRRTHGRRVVLDLEEMELHAGEVLAVAGPNGAGKSTLFRVLLQLERADRGTVFIDGVALSLRDEPCSVSASDESPMPLA